MEYCPICGQYVPIGKSLFSFYGAFEADLHRCSEKKLRAIDAALRDESPSDRKETFEQRLGSGSKMLSDEFEDTVFFKNPED
jgi:hypothetical protein